MRKRLMAMILLVTVPILFGLAWFMSERSFALSMEQEKQRTQMTQSLVLRELQSELQGLDFSNTAAYARQYMAYYQSQGIQLIFCWNKTPIADAELPNANYEGLLCGRRAAMLDTLSRPQKYTVAEPVSASLTVILLRDVSDLYLLKERFQRLAFAAAGGASLLLSLAAQLLSGMLTRPIRHLTAAAKALAAQTGQPADLPTERKDEIGALASAFAEMQSAVDAREARLREESASRQALLDALAHEMRTPLTSLLGNARLLQRELPAEERSRIADSMAKEIRRLTDMDQQLMKLTALQYDPPEMETIQVLQLLRETAERLQAGAADVHIAVDGVDSVITGDRELLSLLADNLAVNALHASSAGMTVTLRAEPCGFSVRDQGIGMKEKDILHACEPFWKADKARTRRHGGAGLGLSLCQRIAEIHGGRLTFDSESGRGTAVAFTMPLQACDDSVTSSAV
ncbi:MAG: HAMP domain-containing histidine kinase [Clostridia bacterium]|nr:HAMP domain-containing histidine kinase [Clostridia bacterium]